MRIAVLADIHGNLPAFEAVLKQLAQDCPDQVIIAGDVINCAPDSAECWRLAQSLGYPILRGNHERYAAHYGTDQAAPAWTTEQFAPLWWTVAQLTAQERQQMAQLPLSLRYAEAPELLFVHASARGDRDTVHPYTADEELCEMFPGVQERFIVRGHNHNGQVRLWRDGYVVTCASVGLPLDGNPTAQYLLLDQGQDGWLVRHRSVPYPVEVVAKRFRDTGYLAAAGPMGRLYLREILTASYQIVPFLQLYHQWSKETEITLGQAVDRFLNVY